MESFLIATGVVALAEIGDKTQLLALLLAARYRRPWPILGGILVATLVNHALAGAVGVWLTTWLGPAALRVALGLAFLAMAIWVSIPDKAPADPAPRLAHGVFLSTIVAFFLAEMGDKTQFATVALAAQSQAAGAVIVGSTLGMMIANVPVVLLGGRIADRLPVRAVHAVAALIFLGMAVATFVGAGQRWGL